jgi:hypothetical protein
MKRNNSNNINLSALKIQRSYLKFYATYFVAIEGGSSSSFISANVQRPIVNKYLIDKEKDLNDLVASGIKFLN